MKAQVILITYQIILLDFLLSASNDQCARNIDITNGKSVFFPELDSIVCLNEDNFQLTALRTNYGIFQEADGLTDLHLPLVGDVKLKFKFSTDFKYVVAKKTDESKTILFISKTHRDELITRNNYHYKSIYYKYDFECFRKDPTNIDDEKDDLLASLGGQKFISNNDNLVCFWFDDEKTGSVTLTLNGNDLHITKASRTTQSSYLSKDLPRCKENGPSFTILPNQIVNILAVNERHFCIPSATHSLDTIKRAHSSEKNNHIENYCKYENQNGDTFCLKIGDDFEYAIFQTDSSVPFRKIVLSHQTNLAASITASQLNLDLSIPITQIKCGNNEMYTNKDLKFMSISDKSPNIRCIIGSEFISEYIATHIENGQSKAHTYKGCAIPNSKDIAEGKVVKVQSNDQIVCLPHGYRIIKHIQAQNLNFEKYVHYEDKVCVVEFTSSICYLLKADVNYVKILNEYTRESTLIYRSGFDINLNVADQFLYAPKYYKNDVVFVKKENVDNFDAIKDKDYVFVSENKVIFLVAGMAALDRIHLKNVLGCKNREISVDPTQTTPSQGTFTSSDCDDFYKQPANANQIKVLTKEKITTCIAITCTKLIYSFSVKDINDNDGKGTITECANEGRSCILNEDGGKLVVYRVQQTQQNGKLFVATQESNINLKVEQSILYETDYYKYDVLCVRTANIQTAPPTSSFQLTNGLYSCSVVQEIQATDETINYKSHSDCLIPIKLHRYQVNPNPQKPGIKSSCDYLINVDQASSFRRVDSTLLPFCLSRTCSKIKSLIDLSNRFERFSYTSTEYAIPTDCDKACADKVTAGAIIKVKSSRYDAEKIFYTKELTDDIPLNTLYKTFYGPGSFTCFMKNRVTNFQQIQANSVFGVNANRMCVIANEVTGPIEVQINMEKDCHRNIKISSTTDTDLQTLDTDFTAKCNRYTSTEPGITPQIISDAISDVNECRTNLCLKVDYIVNKDGSMNDCTPKACTISDQDQIKYYKIQSQYNHINTFVVPTDAQLLQSNTNGFYRSTYYVSEIVCYKESSLREVDKAISNVYFSITGDRGCFILKELTSQISIELNAYGTCKRRITLSNKDRPETAQNMLSSDDRRCEEFSKAESNTKTLELTLQNLKLCVKHLCLQPKFIVKKSASHGDYAAIRTECEGQSDACVTDAIEYDYVKLHNPYTDEYFYVQNSVKRTIQIDANFFYPSPFYKKEVMCILSTQVTQPSQFRISDSYTLDSYKCLILKELTDTNSIEIKTQGECTRSITVVNESPQTQSFQRNVDTLICQDFLLPIPSTSSVQSILLANLKNCIIHSCSTVMSKVEITANVALNHAKVVDCTGEGTRFECLEDGKTYDFIKITITGFPNPRFFRTFVPTSIESYTPSGIHFHNSKYNVNDVVCFKSTLLIRLSSFVSSAGVFQDGNRVCVISKELSAVLNVDYKIAETYNQPIQFTKDETVIDLNHGGSTKTDCSQFFPQEAEATTNDYEIVKATLIDCVTKTFSMVIFVVKLEQPNDAYTLKKITMCNRYIDVRSCFTNIENYEVVKIKSPYRQEAFYVHSPNIVKSNAAPYSTYFYKNSYHSDDIVCVHKNFLKRPADNHPLSPGFIKRGDVTCVIVRDTSEIHSMDVKLFNKCDKTVHFGRFTIESNSELTDECQPFTTVQTAETVLRMSISTLRSCIQSTCSKIIYYTSDDVNGNKFIKKTSQCNAPEDGSITCLEGVTKYHLAKVQLGFNDAKYAYVEEDNNDSIETEEYDSFFYASKYFKNEVICTRTDMIRSESLSIKKVKKGNKNQVCFIVNELNNKPSLKLLMKNGCTKEIEIDSTNERTEGLIGDDNICKMFYSGVTDDNKIQSLAKDDIKKCVEFTCSKVTSLVPTDSVIEYYTTRKVTHCSKPHGDSSCIGSTNYDFVKVENAYNSLPMYFRSKDYDSNHQGDNPIKFYSSIYYHDDIICYTPSIITNLKEIVSLPGVYSKPKRTCIMGSEVSKEILIKLNVGDKCKRNIYVTNKASTESTHSSHLNDVKCSIYYEGENNLVVQSNEIMLECAAHTCSTFEYVNQSISEMDCKDDKSKCQRSKNIFTYGKVTSPYKTNPILVMTEDAKTKWISQIENIEKYKISYSVEEIICFKNDMITKSKDTPKAYVNKELNIICLQSQSDDGEFILTTTGMAPMKLKLIKSTDETLTKISTQQYTVVINGIRSTSSGSISEVFKYEGKLNKNQLLKDFSELESCAKETEKENTREDFDKLHKPDAYAFTIKSKIVVSHPIGFLFTESSVCGKHFNQDLQPPDILELADSTKAFHHLECVLVSNDYLAININSKTLDKVLNTEQSCLDELQLKKNCDFVHQYSTNIFICYISRKAVRSEDDFKDDEEEASQSPVYVMIKKEHCYIPKIMKHQRVAMCKIDETGLKINVIDFEMLGKIEETSKSESSKIQQSSWSFLGLIGISLIVLLVLFSTRKKSKLLPVEKSV